MLKCAYCFKQCNPTREHVIPRWYNDTPGDSETFNARSPIAHTKGDLLIKDVCETCNSVKLGSLDYYGKSLYLNYFEESVFSGESIAFDYDYEILVRWLLKLCYNSARAHNADTKILRRFAKMILGEESLGNHVLVALSLITPSCISTDPKPAKRNDVGHFEIHEPMWFRIAQLQLPVDPPIVIVQRQVVINSYAFSIFAVSPDKPNQQQYLELIYLEFSKVFPNAMTLDKSGRVAISAGKNHAIASITNLFGHYPTRFLGMDNTLVEENLMGKYPIILVKIPQVLIENQQPEPIVEILRDMVFTKENATAYKQKISILVNGFDDDARELWQIPKVRAFLCLLFVACPFVMFLSHPEGSLLKLLASCWIYEEGQDEQGEKTRMSQFLNIGFDGLNKLAHRLSLSIELNEEIVREAAKTLFGEYPPESSEI